MNIDTIHYLNAEQTALSVTTADGQQLTVPWPCRTWHNESIQEWLAAGNTISEAPAKPLEALRAEKLAEINEDYKTTLEPFVKEYPEVERNGWLQQKSEATAYLRWYNGGQWDPQPNTEMLDFILAGRTHDGEPETLYELSQKVLTNAALFTRLQELTGHRHRLEKRAKKAASAEELAAVTHDFAALLEQLNQEGAAS